MAAPPPPGSSGIRVVLVDARAERREIMRHVVEGGDAHAVVVGDAESADTALQAVGDLRADAVVVEIQMPVAHGLFTVAELRGRYPRLGIIVCSFHVDQATQDQAREQGADAYLTKPISPRTLNAALKDLDRPDAEEGWQVDPNDAHTFKAMT